jgi:PAS domain S-box-containing protein
VTPRRLRWSRLRYIGPVVGTVVVERRLPSEAQSVGEARRLLRRAVAEADVAAGSWVEDALVAVSELVTNALVHAGTPIGLTVRVDGSGVRVEVADGSRHLPQPRPYAVNAGTGRGLSLVDQLVQDWGTDPVGAGKVVWFELGSTPDDPRAESSRERASPYGAAGAGAGPDDLVEVVLLGVPLLTHMAWQEHAASLLREYLLFQLDAGTEDTVVFEAHAAASDAMSVLFEQIPAPVLGSDPQALMASATEHGVTEEQVVLRMSAFAAASFRRLDHLLEAAAALADARGWLTVPTQPELRQLRRWLCRQVRDQQAGGVPEAWAVPDDLTLPPPTEIVGWDRSTVTASDRAVVAADDTDRIIAISPSALTVLGYTDAGELLGRRLLSIIPERYHQAHLAGFTMHLTNGRAPLMGREVIVPVARRDGSERLVGLTVTSTRLAHGRHVFTADIRTG